MRRFLFFLILFGGGGCVSTSSPVSLEETARAIHSKPGVGKYGLYFRDLEDGEPLEISAEVPFSHPKGRRLSILGRVLEELSAGRVSWKSVQVDLRKMIREGDSDAGVRLISHFGRDAEMFLSPRSTGHLIEAIFDQEHPPEILEFLDTNSKFLGRFQNLSGRFYILILFQDGEGNSAREEAIHSYMESKS